MDKNGNRIPEDKQVYVLLEEDEKLPQLSQISGGECRHNAQSYTVYSFRKCFSYKLLIKGLFRSLEGSIRTALSR